MKILILAETCNPEWASLPSFSFYLVNAIANETDTEVVLATHIRNKTALEKFGKVNFEIVYIDNEYIAKPLYLLGRFLRMIKLGGWMTSMALKYPSNIAFEYEVWKKFKSKLKYKEFDFVHRISPVSPTIASPIAKWSPVPFILGPINGGLQWPSKFVQEIKKEREILIFFRKCFHFLPFYNETFECSKVILAAFKHVENDVPEHCRNKIIRFDELGIDHQLFCPRTFNKVNDQCTFLFVGRLVPYKCPDVVVQAFVLNQRLRRHKLLIVGDGPERPYLEQLVLNHDLKDCVQFMGWKNQEEVSSIMNESDVFVFPTIREVGGNVIVEAMASGLPCIVPDYGGPSELVAETTGVKVPLTDKNSLITAYSEKMELLANDIQLRAVLAKNARDEIVKSHSWKAKGQKIKALYQKINHP